VTELREDLGDLAEEVVAVAAGKGPQILAVPPALAAGLAGGGPLRQWRYLRREAVIE
jgi:hypothetical protein